MRVLCSIRRYNLYGNILTGFSAFVLGLTWLFDKTGLSVPVAALFLLLTSGVSLVACLNPAREHSDEMASAHEGMASGIALKALLLACGMLCCLEMAARQTIPVAPACCLCIGVGLVCYGIAFDRLERE